MKLSSKAVVTAMTFAALLTGCASKEKAIQLADLQTPRWSLTTLDGNAIKLPAKKKLPSLSVDEKMTATGLAGCNNFIGEAELEADDHKFRITHLNSTMKLCLKDEMALNDTIISTLSDWSRIDIEKGVLTLTGKQHTLVYQAKRK
jgi:heat shock protein HslJ